MPKECKAAIVTCGGLCPGLNSVIREVVTKGFSNNKSNNNNDNNELVVVASSPRAAAARSSKRLSNNNNAPRESLETRIERVLAKQHT